VALLTQLDQALNQLQAAYKSGDFSAVGQAQANVQRLTAAYLAARGKASPTASPTGSR
jgi:hypothetical protein